MPIPIIQVPDFPDVPELPGVPPLARSALLTAVAPQLTRLVTDLSIVKSLLGIAGKPQWGIFDAAGKNPVLTGDCVVDFRHTRQVNVPKYPIENGGFQSYNKVQMPREGTITIAQSGSTDTRGTFLRKIDTLIASLDLYSIVMPEYTIFNMNVTSDSYDRSALEGAQMLSVTLRLEEIRVAPAAAFTNTKAPENAAQTNGGPVQPTTPTAAQAAQLTPAT